MPQSDVFCVKKCLEIEYPVRLGINHVLILMNSASNWRNDDANEFDLKI